ncbi:MAG: hypothetical protein KTR18_15365 [Acidiferrobacterales bacterium]|nr:hypothetical protein [Acidiferrobacterales bacterium]
MAFTSQKSEISASDSDFAAYSHKQLGNLILDMQRFIFIYVLFVLLVACDQEEQVHVDSSSTATRTALACNLAQSGFPQSADYSALIRSLQSQVKLNSSVPNLEQLGWAYAAFAKEAESPEHHYLSSQVAVCIESLHGPGPESSLLQAHALHQQHQFADAQKIAKQLVQQRGLWFDHAVYGDTLLEQGKLQLASQAYQAMVDQKPGPEAYGRIGELRWLSGDIPGAIEMYVLAARSTSPRDPGASAYWDTRLAHTLWINGQHVDAKALLHRALEKVEDYTPALHLSARMLLADDQPQAAADLLKHVIVLREEPEYLWTLWEALQITGDKYRALEVQQRLVELGSQDDLRTASLFLSTTQSDATGAETLAQRELLGRRDALTLDALALALLRLEEIEKAEVILQEALDTGIQHPRLFLHATLLADKKGEHVSARQWLQRTAAFKHVLLPTEQKLLVDLTQSLSRESMQKS